MGKRTDAGREFDCIYTFDGRWWTAEAPSLRGAYTQGRTRASARKNLLGAIRDLLASYEALGEPPPFAEVAVERTRVA
jgi:predicted RNase H-like HicB family nuclease